MAPRFLDRFYPLAPNETAAAAAGPSALALALPPPGQAGRGSKPPPPPPPPQQQQHTWQRRLRAAARRLQLRWRRRRSAALAQQRQAAAAERRASLPGRRNVARSWSLPCVRLQAVLDGVGMRWFDWAAVHVSGAELEVLRSVDWERTHSSVLLVGMEGDDPATDAAVHALLTSHSLGYRRVARDKKTGERQPWAGLAWAGLGCRSALGTGPRVPPVATPSPTHLPPHPPPQHTHHPPTHTPPPPTPTAYYVHRSFVPSIPPGSLAGVAGDDGGLGESQAGGTGLEALDALVGGGD